MSQNFNETMTPGISFSLKRGEILIYHSTVQALGDPCFICFLFNQEKKSLAVQKSDSQTIDSFIVPGYDSGDWDFRVYSEPLLKIIWQQCGWDRSKTYRCFGKLYTEHNIIDFDLRKAEVVVDDL